MNNIVRAWKDETYCQSLLIEGQATLSANPVEEIELTDAVLESIVGALGSFSPELFNDLQEFGQFLQEALVYNAFNSFLSTGNPVPSASV